MKVPVLLTLLLLMFIGCRQAEKKPIKIIKTDTLQSLPKTATAISEPDDSLVSANWRDSLIDDYIKRSDNDLVKLSRGDTAIHEGWMFDQIEKRGAATYFVYNIGHDNDTGAGVVYVSDSWVFIDSLSRKLYESQPDESLKEWKH
ncbi:hypothetical protein ACFFGT_08170 [Mucilaginibacter angelicae]|uniref:Lipoprotein n=1 Tax=Mucilaginibacter angelicae TaxID=869718 RepID=A0ABV6L3Z1_9SPHI